MANKPGIGRGLDALFSELNGVNQANTDEHAKKIDVINISVENLISGKYQPRKVFLEEELKELANSIKSHGIIQPLIIRKIPGGLYEIIAGERRWRAAKLAGLKDVPVIVKDVDDNTALAFALIENIQREDLNPLDTAMALKRLIEEFAMTHEQVSAAIGRSRTMVTNMLRLLSLAEPLQQMLINKDLEMGHARALLSFNNDQQLELANIVIAKGLSVRETEKLVQKFKNIEVVTEKPLEKNLYQNMAKSWSDTFSSRLSSKVNVKINPKGEGRVAIYFNSPEEIEWLAERLKIDLTEKI